MCAKVFKMVLAALVIVGSGQPSQGRADGPPAGRNEELRKELLRMAEEDQAARKEAIRGKMTDPAVVAKMTAIDRKNTARLKEIIDRHGWPGKSLVGDDGANAAWLLVQHADLDRPFQKRCLDLMKEAVKKKEASAQNLAYLTDRVLVGEGKKQIYGTQFKQEGDKFVPQPIEDEANVDRRRKEVGLPTLEEYRKLMEEVYRRKPPDKK
jgi:hypothetical protein